MKVCLILEGSYPYVHGGVSTWMHQMIQNMPDIEFALWVIGDKSERRGKFVYELPKNVTSVTEVFLDDALRLTETGWFRRKITPEESEALRSLIRCADPDWDLLFKLYNQDHLNPITFLKSKTFLNLLTEICQKEYPYFAYSDTFHTLRSMLLPVLHVLGSPIPEADVYHSICTGYAGLLATMGARLRGKPLLLTEHGIYSREREEEIIRASWVIPAYKQRWIQFFYMLSRAIYSQADQVSCLFYNAMRIQCSIGAREDRCRVISNGVDYAKFAAVPMKEEDGFLDIGAAVRMAPIKDIKTMLYAFYELHKRVPNTRLHVLGGVDDEEYAQECHELVEQLGLTDVLFPGRVDMVEYMQKFDFTILTSISEGQPLTILESFAAARPCVCTNVGCCSSLIAGEPGDTLGTAGFCVPPMNSMELANAMEQMCSSRQMRLQMGRIGQQRVERYYQQEQMVENYRKFYEEGVQSYGRHRI